MAFPARHWVLAFSTAIAACGTPVAKTGPVSSSIALLSNGVVAVVNPDQGSVSFVDATTLGTMKTVPVGGHPRALLPLTSGSLWVPTFSAGAIAIIDPIAMTQTGTIDNVCQGPVQLAESPDGTWVALACEWSGQVMRVDPATLAATTLAASLVRPRSVAIVGSSVIVTEYTSGTVVEIDGDGKTRSVSLVPTSAPYRPALTQMTANLAEGLVPAFGHLFVLNELVNHTGNTSAEVVAADYGTVVNNDPKINPAATRLSLSGETVSAPFDTPSVYARFDIPQHSFSGPVAAAPFGDRYLLVSHISTNDVAVIDTTATDPNLRLVASYAVGNGPSGVAVDEANSIGYVDNAFDGSVSQIDLTLPFNASAPVYSAEATLVRGLPSPYSTEALAGRQVFYDATNTHVTPSRVVACATCHPNGTDDGLVWFMQTPSIPLKRRRTPHLANSQTNTAPFHWDGSFANMTDLVNGTITGLMAGDDLLVDATTVQHFVNEIVLRPVGPPQDPDAVARGLVLFESPTTGCGGCHSGSSLTDDLNHAPLNPMSLSADDVFTSANTPALHGLFYRAPFFHDGRAPTLSNLLTRPDASMHGNVSGLSSADLSDLEAYLLSL